MHVLQSIATNCGLWGFLFFLPLLAEAQQPAVLAPTPPRMLEVEIHAGRFVGMPIRWTERDAILMEANGRFQTFTMDALLRHQLLQESFLPQSLPEARANLAAELGAGFETLIAGPYVIAAPTGTAPRWRERFTSLLSGYLRYFEVRGWPLRKPDFPMCVVVLPDREAFVRYAAREVKSLPEQAVGSYFPKSNRCVLYQLPGSRGTDWSQTEATIVHEAIHQLAYNSGVHERLFENPLWFVEGLATMFEEAAVYDTQAARSAITDRMHTDMLARLKPLLSTSADLEQRVQSLILNDDLFRSESLNAYALGWGMTFTLAERLPRQYGQYVQLQAARRFGSYSPAEREADFRRAFEMSPAMLAYQMQQLLGN